MKAVRLTCTLSVTALIMVPTRELALQTSAVMRGLGKHITGADIVVVRSALISFAPWCA